MCAAPSLSPLAPSFALTDDQHTGLEEAAEGAGARARDGQGGRDEDEETARAYDDDEEEAEEEEEEEEVIEVTEEEMLKLLDRDRDPFIVCSSLFRPLPEDAHDRLKVLTPGAARHLIERGYLVMDAALPPAAARELAAAARDAFDGGLMVPAASLGADSDEHRYTDRSARSDAILWLSPGGGDYSNADADADTNAAAEVRSRVRGALSFLDALRGDLETFTALNRGVTELQLAAYPGSGAHYVRHRDALPDDGSEAEQRRVTAIVYANEAWAEADGGALRLWAPTEDASSDFDPDAGCACHAPGARGVQWEPRSSSPELQALSVGGPPSLPSGNPSPRPSDGALSVGLPEASQGDVDGGSVNETELARAPKRYVDIAPLAGRAVVFLSGCCDHEVRPAAAFRVALTAWMQ